MAERVRFYLDEHIDIDVARALRRRNVDVITVQEAGQRAAADEALLQTATQLGRVFVSQDADVLRIAARGVAHAGIVFARQGTSVSAIIRGLLLIYEATDMDGMRGQIEYI